MKKQKVYREFDVRYSFEGCTVKELVKKLESLELPEDALFEMEAGDDYGSPSVKAVFSWREEETDKEYETRKAKEKQRENYDREVYERLKKKFG